jgi:glutathione S-transferase
VSTIYNAFNERSQAWWAARMRGNGVDITTLERQPAAEQRELITPALDRLAAALDAQGGTNGHFAGDSITFADLAAAAFVKWFMVVSDDAEYVLTVNGGRWKGLLDEIKAS